MNDHFSCAGFHRFGFYLLLGLGGLAMLGTLFSTTPSPEVNTLLQGVGFKVGFSKRFFTTNFRD
jgi:hypothetical protein